MKLSIKTILLLAVFLFNQNLNSQILKKSMLVDSIQRDYIIFIPKNYQPNLPVVFNLHGGLEDYQAEWHMNYTLMNEVADTAGFIVVYPYSKIPYWNVNVFDPNEPDVDDIGFILALIDTLQTNYDVDMDRIYCSGGFLGSTMTQHLLCLIGYRFAAGAGIAAYMGEYTAANCTPIRPISIMMCYGTNDPDLPWDGSRKGFISPEKNLEFWIEKNNCITPPDTILLPDNNSFDASYVEKYNFKNNDENIMISFLKVINGGHSWPGACCNYNWGYPTNRDINASEEIWNFCKNYSNPITNLAYAKNIITYPKYFNSYGDTLFVSAEIVNPDSHKVEMYAIVTSISHDSVGKIVLFNDEIHNDANKADYQYGGYGILKNLEENFYEVELVWNDLDFSVKHTFYKHENFTTAGPVIEDGFEVKELSDDRIGLANFTLKNTGQTLMVPNIVASISIIDSSVKEIIREMSGYGDLGPGETKKHAAPFAFYPNTNAAEINLKLEVSSNGIVYWGDTLKIIPTAVSKLTQNDIPIDYSLSQNYPNPFNPRTTIKYSIPKKSKIVLKVFDVLGNEVSTLLDKVKTKGIYEIEYDGSELTSGIYFYRLDIYTGEPGISDTEVKLGHVFARTKKMILIK